MSEYLFLFVFLLECLSKVGRLTMETVFLYCKNPWELFKVNNLYLIWLQRPSWFSLQQCPSKVHLKLNYPAWSSSSSSVVGVTLMHLQYCAAARFRAGSISIFCGPTCWRDIIAGILVNCPSSWFHGNLWGVQSCYTVFEKSVGAHNSISQRKLTAGYFFFSEHSARFLTRVLLVYNMIRSVTRSSSCLKGFELLLFFLHF